jgi:FAD binding domain-containing protein
MTRIRSAPTTVAARQLRSSIHGTVLVATDLGYEAGRLWNGAVDTRPAAIVRCADDHDVSAAVQIARDHGLPVAVRGRRHGWTGPALVEDGIVLDLSAMREVTIHPGNGYAVAQGGATAGDIVAAAARYGLAPVTGTVSAIGMAGLTLSGGYGPLNGKYGLALDNLRSADVVVADGTRVIASNTDDRDLYWAVRGGGGNFGVVTTATYRLHPLPFVLAGLVLFPLTQAATVLRGYRKLIAEASDELTVMAGFLAGPDGQPQLFLFPTWSGNPAQGEQAIGRVDRLGTPTTSHVRAMSYQAALNALDAQVVNGRHYAVRTRSLPTLTEDTASLLVETARRAPSRLSALTVHHFHGAAARIPVAHTAFATRRNHLMLEIRAAWEPHQAANRATHQQWVDALSEQLGPHPFPGGHTNLLGPDEHDRAIFGYGLNAQAAAPPQG